VIEQTLSIVKPDAVERNLENRIKSFFKEKNLKILKNKKVHITKEEAAEFYKVHQTKPFYKNLCNYLSSGPIVVMVLEGYIHPFFGKIITSSKKYHAHDESNKFKVGDNVKIIESKPYSKKKRWEVIDK